MLERAKGKRHSFLAVFCFPWFLFWLAYVHILLFAGNCRDSSLHIMASYVLDVLSWSDGFETTSSVAATEIANSLASCSNHGSRLEKTGCKVV